MMRLRRTVLATIALLSVVSFCVPGHTQHRLPDVEFVPTPQEVVLEMLKMAKVTQDDVLYDLGCGDGRIVITAAKLFGARGIGIDIDPDRISESNENARKAGVTDRVKFILADLFQTNLSEATVVSLYLLPELNLRLRPKLFQELRPGTRIVSHDFDMGDWKPDDRGRLGNVKYDFPETVLTRESRYYYWVIPADVADTWRWSFRTPTGERHYTLRLSQNFQEVSGDASVNGRKITLTDTRLVGDRLSFSLQDEMDKQEGVVRFNGRVNQDIILGSAEVQGGSFAGKHHWTARRDR